MNIKDILLLIILIYFLFNNYFKKNKVESFESKKLNINNVKIALVLTVWKRDYLEDQLKIIFDQTKIPDYIIVFQNENHIDIEPLKKKYNFIHINSSYNTKFFGRFSILFNFPVDICIVMDDDILPASNCIKNYVNQCINKNAIIGGNGRIIGKREDSNFPDKGIRGSKEVDYVGHMWVFKKDLLYYMFSKKPYTYDTGEDMHLCFTSKLHNIKSFIGEQINDNDVSDNNNNNRASDDFASYKVVSVNPLRKEIENYWVNQGVKSVE
jgi:hypothetical protein